MQNFSSIGKVFQLSQFFLCHPVHQTESVKTMPLTGSPARRRSHETQVRLSCIERIPQQQCRIVQLTSSRLRTKRRQRGQTVDTVEYWLNVCNLF